MPFSRFKSIMKMKPSVKVIQSQFFALSGAWLKNKGWQVALALASFQISGRNREKRDEENKK